MTHPLLSSVRVASATVLLVSLAACAAPQEKVALPKGLAKSLEDACKSEYTDCRRNFKVQIRKADGSVFEKTFELTYPPVQHGTFVTIFPGETLRLEADVAGDQITRLKSVGEGDPSKTIVLEFKQAEGASDMMLIVRNPFHGMLKYQAGMMVPENDDVQKTSSCPVIAGKLGFETWPHPVFQLLLTDFHLLAENDTHVTCE